MNFKYIVMRRKSDSYKIVKFMVPELGVLVLGRGYKWLQYFFLENLLLCSCVFIWWIKNVVMKRKSASSNIMNFMAP